MKTRRIDLKAVSLSRIQLASGKYRTIISRGTARSGRKNKNHARKSIRAFKVQEKLETCVHSWVRLSCVGSLRLALPNIGCIRH